MAIFGTGFCGPWSGASWRVALAIMLVGCSGHDSDLPGPMAGTI
jgi:hypothetical protein